MWVFINRQTEIALAEYAMAALRARVRWEGLCEGLRRGRKASDTHCPCSLVQASSTPTSKAGVPPGALSSQQEAQPHQLHSTSLEKPESQENVQWSEDAEAAAGSKHRTPTQPLLKILTLKAKTPLSKEP